MAAGDLIVANLADLDGELAYQAELQGYLWGDEDPWVITDLSGLGGVRNSGSRDRHAYAAKIASGVHIAEPGGIVFTAISRGTAGDPEAMEEAIAEAEAAWTIDSPTRDPLALHLLAPHYGHVSVLGWPDQLEPTRTFAGGGIAVIVASFSRVDLVTTSHNGGS